MPKLRLMIVELDVNQNNLMNMGIFVSRIEGKVNIGGKTFNGVNNVRIENGTITIDGKSIEELNGDEPKVFKVEIVGNVQNIETEDADVEVKGNAGSIVSKNGNVTCGNVSGNVDNKNGNVICGDVRGDVNTMNGNIIRNDFM